uniref:Uncharacterized protein n=1 Tax=Rhizophagus irregularis (strain DAOM 181602 / DAOM 197198 / MUCL 43194) TaxID=747089 RepID=U9U314_RHIID
MKKLEEIQDLIDKLGLENPLIADEFVKATEKKKADFKQKTKEYPYLNIATVNV